MPRTNSRGRVDCWSRAARKIRKRIAEAVEYACTPIEPLEDRRMLAGWTAVGSNGTPPANGGAMMLLTDGSVMVNPVASTATSSNSPTNQWFRLVPDSSGNYANGTWSTIASMSEARNFFTTAMLPDGKVIAIGGEYPKFSNTAEIYDPVNNFWTPASPVPTPATSAGLSGVVVGASNTSPITITVGNASGTGGLVNGDSVTIAGVSGNLAANGTWTISNVSLNSFTLNASNGVGAGTFINNGSGQWSSPRPQFGDDPIMLLPDGRILAGYYTSATDPVSGATIYPTYIYSPPPNNTWTPIAASRAKLHNDRSDEETWVKLPDDSILSYDVFASEGGTFQAQRYIPSQDRWVDASTTDPANKPSILSDPPPSPTAVTPNPIGLEGDELGPGLLLPDGRVIFFGANGNTAYYNPTTNLWSAGPAEPTLSVTVTPNATSTIYSVTTGNPATDSVTAMVAADAPAALLPNGHVLIALSPLGPPTPTPTGGYSFPRATAIYEFDPLAPAASAFTAVTPGGGLLNVNCFTLNMLMLPTGQVLLANEGAGFQIYTPDGGPQDQWRPVITGIAANGDNTYTLTGTQLNGISEGSSYGDDEMNSSNYPILRLQDGAGNVTYARTSNWSNKGGVASGPTPETVQFSLAQGKSLADYVTYTVIANGIASAPAVNGVGPTMTVPAYTDSGHAPAVGWVNGQAYIAWRGRSNNLLNIMRLNADGTASQAHYVAGATLAGSPALATIGNQMYVAFTGNDDHLYVSPVNINGDSLSVPNLVPLEEKSNDSPALASLNGRLYIAWTGQDDRLNIMQFTDDLKGVEPHYVPDVTVAGSPALTAAYERLWVAFTGDTDDLYASPVDINGAIMNLPSLKPLGESADASPALAQSNGRLFIAWQGQGDGKPNLMEITPAGDGVEPHIVKENDLVDGGIALGTNSGGTSILSWTSTGTDDILSLAFFGALPPAFGISRQNGGVVVNGGNVADAISIGRSPSGALEVTLNGTTQDFELGDISRVTVYTSPLTNTVNVRSTIPGLPITLNTGPGTNTINVASAGHTLSDIASLLTVNGAVNAPTTLILDDSGDSAAQTYSPSSTSFTSNAVNIAFHNIAALIVKGGAGPEVYNVGGLSPSTSLNLDVGNGAATVNLTSNGDPRTSILGPISITGAAGSTQLNVDDQNDPASGAAVDVSTLAAGGTISGLFPQVISYDGGAHVGGVSLLTSHGGANTINVRATDVPLSINLSRATAALAGNAVNVGTAHSVQTIRGPLTIGDAGSAETIRVDAADDPTVPFTLEGFTPASDTPFGRVLSLSPAPIAFRLADTGLVQVKTLINSAAVLLANQAADSKSLELVDQPNVTVHNFFLPSGLSATATSGLHLTGNTIGATTLLNDTLTSADANAFAQVTLNHSINASLTGNTLSSLTLTGASASPVVNNNSITASLAINGGSVTNVTITNNRIGNVLLGAVSSGVIETNDIGWAPSAGGNSPAVGLDLQAAFAGPIDHNDIHSATVGVNYAVPQQLFANRIFANATGLIMPINTTTGGLGFFAGSGPNDIYNNAVGVNLTGRMQLQHIYSNTTGVIGSGILGGDTLDTANLIQGNITGVDFAGTIQFNRIVGNATGVLAHSNQIVIHNLIYRNTGAGVRTNGAVDARVYSNTFYTTAGNNLQVDGASRRVEVLNNVFQADGGTDLYVATDSRTGFFSDYNDLYSTGTGKVAHYILDFSDFLDLVRDVGLFDLHSIGTSSVNPAWAQPRFANLAADDFRIAQLAGTQHDSSPTVDAGDPLTDLMLPPGYVNLLANPSFEGGTSSWNVNLGGSAQPAATPAWIGSSYFNPGAVASGFAEQTVSLTAAGFTTQQLDAQNVALIFGARVRAAGETPADQGKLILTFLDGSGNTIGAPDTIPASNVGDRWELLGDRVHAPAGARSARYRFESLRQSGTTDDGYLDGAFLYVLPDTTAPDQGAYGEIDATEILTAAPHIQLLEPQIYVDWELNQPHTVTWRSFGGNGSPVRIDLYKDGAGGPTLLANITPSTPDTGAFTWIPQQSGLGYGTFGLRIQVSLVSGGAAPDRSAETFAIPEHTQAYYVNDGTTAGDQYTSAIGSNRNTGRLPSAPKPFLSTILSAYPLSAGDTVYVDNGTYPHVGSIVLSGNPAIGNDQGVTVLGPTSSGTMAQILMPDAAPAFDINSGNFVTLSHLAVAGGSYGVWVHGGSSSFSGSDLTLANSTVDGIRLESDSSAGAQLNHITAYGNGRDGISVGGTGVSLAASVAHDNAGAGIRYDNAGAASITSSQSYANQYGLVIANGFGNPLATVGQADLTLNRGNLIHDNSALGITASGFIAVTGNTVYNTGGVNPPSSAIGINLSSGASAAQNVVWGNYTGIYSNSGGAASIANNRVYDNVGTGIYAANSTNATGNESYANAVGIEGDTSPTWSNNLIYNDAVAGIWLHGGFSANLLNNTIYLPGGDGIRVESGGGNFTFQHVNIRNNIVWVQAGYGLTITPDAEINLQSDYNDLYATGAGKVGLWEGVARPTMQSWRLASYADFGSLSQDPRFVDPGAGDFHEQSAAGSFHGGSLAPVINPASGLPASAPGSLSSDSATSPAVDRGDAASSFSGETAPSGGFINLGTYGNTAQASRSSIPYVLVLAPNGGETVVEGETCTLTWRSEVSTGTVSIDLMNGNTPIANIATGIPNSGSYAWAVPASIAPGNYTVRISRTTPSPSADISDAPFTLSGPVHTFYVNDSGVEAGDFTTAPGDDAVNSGLDPAHPKASIRAILQAYNLAPGDVIDIDAGTYALSNNIVIPAARSGITIRGFHDPANPLRISTINRNSAASGAYVFDIQGATGVTLDQLTLVGGVIGVNLADDANSAGFTLSNSDVSQAGDYNVFVGASNAGATITGNRIHDSNGFYRVGINVGPSPGTLVSNNQVYNNDRYGIAAGPGVTVSSNTVYANGFGIAATSATVSGNIAHDNGNAGILASGNSIVSGNTTYGQAVAGNFYPRAGIELEGGTVSGNISYGNSYGVFVAGAGTVTNNLLYNNSIDGAAFGNATIFNGNVVHGNDWGVVASYAGSLANNLIYDNASGGIQLTGGSAMPIANNTIYQSTGDALALYPAQNSYPASIRNNILWAQGGYDLRIDPGAQAGVTADYNDLFVSGTGSIGLWQNTSHATLAAWQLASLQDANSLCADPLFVSAAGGDFHEQSLYGSFHGGSLAPILDAATGLPVAAPVTLTNDAAHSPTIDRGDAGSAYSNEPVPNGGYVNLGAYGNTTQASKSPASYMLVTQPSGGQTLIEGQSYSIDWRNASIGSGQVNIDLMTLSGGLATLQSNIATGAPNSGQYAWMPAASIPIGSNYLIRVTLQDGASALSAATFSLAGQTHLYYVNDSTVQVGDWTTAPGDDGNSGLDPAHPKASVTGVLASYVLTPADTILVDQGTYNLTGDISLLPAASGITIRGYNDPSFPGRMAVLNRGNLGGGAAITLAGADDVTIDHLGLTGGLYGLQSSSAVASDNATVSNCEIFGNASYAVYLIGGADNFALTNCLIHNDDAGIGSSYNHNLTITGNTIHDLRLRGIDIAVAGGTISGNTTSQIAADASIVAAGYPGALLTIRNNIAHDNTGGMAISGNVLAAGNSVYGNSGIGIRVFGGEARDNVSYGNAYGIYVDSGLADQNRAFNNTIDGIFVSGGTVSQNQVYSNTTGIEGSFSPLIQNNLVYANSLRGIYITNGAAAQILGNTVYQPLGNAIDLLSSESNLAGQHMQLRNNILWAQAGYDLNLSDHAAVGFMSDYNDLQVSGAGKVARISGRDYPTLADWRGEYGFDAHSLSSDPKFANVAGADGLLGYTASADHGGDDNFHLLPTSPAIDAGDPLSSYFGEPAPNGGRTNLGHLGGTAQADLSPSAQSIQILSPFPGQKVEAGHSYAVSWRTAGVMPTQPALLIDAGGPAVGPWIGDAYSLQGSSSSITDPIDLSGVTNPAPQSVYQSFVSGGSIAYQLPVPDGSYVLRLHFMDNISTAAGQRLIDVKVNGTTIESSYDIFAAAGGRLKASVETLNVTAVNGSGILLELVGVKDAAMISGIEVDTPEPSPIPSPSATLQLSTNNGASWSTIASSLPLDAWGDGSYSWTAGPQTSGPTALFRILISGGTLAGTSQPFAITSGGADYYVNDSSLAGDSLTTAAGDNANTGKSPDSPLASIQAVLAQYNPGAGAIIHVDAGTYTLVHDIILASSNSGLVIRGPSGAAAIFDRANSSNGDDNVFEFAAGASNITLDHLSMTGASIGILANFNAGALNNVISRNQIYGNASEGIFIGGSNAGWLITGNTIHDNTGNGYLHGIDVEGSAVTVTGNTIFNQPQAGVYVSGGTGSAISGNEVYASGTGIQAGGAHTISNNRVHDNAIYGIFVGAGALVTANTVYRQTAPNSAGIFLAGGEARGNTVYYNYNGIVANNSVDTIDRNRIYSNVNFGVLFNSAAGRATENLIYANSTAGLVLTASTPVRIENNTIYQPVGDALRFTASPGSVVRSNILWVEAGSDLDLTDAASQTGFVSDYNDLYRGAGASAHVGLWGGTARETLAQWQAASAQDGASIVADPHFQSVKGADQVLGYNPVGLGYDGGIDDNFYLASASPAIDHGYSWSFDLTDILLQPHNDDPATPNGGSPDYLPADQGASLFAASGTPMNWHGAPVNAWYWQYTFPAGFVFPFYGTTYNSVYVSVAGLLQFAGPDNPALSSNSDSALLADARIAPFWTDLRTDQAGNDIYIDAAVPGQLKFTWLASNAAATAPANFSVVLFADGRMRFDYGPGNSNMAPTVGISMGDGQHATFLSYDNSNNLAGADSILWDLTPGHVDPGAYEFQGSSADTTPPIVTSTSPAPIASSGIIAPISQIALSFSEPINPIDAAAPSVYQLVGAGSDGAFGTSDDATFALNPSYVPGSTLVMLQIGGGPLPAGLYRLTVMGAGAGIHDLSGLLLDGAANEIGGTNYVRTFAVAIAPLAITVPGNGTVTISADGTSTNVWVNHNSAVDPPDYTRATDGISSFSITSAGGNATIVLDYSAGQDPLPPSGLSITGGGNNILRLIGTSGNDDFDVVGGAISLNAMTPIAIGPAIASLQISGRGSVDSLAVASSAITLSSDLGQSGPMTLSLSSGASVLFAASQHLGALQITGASSAVLASGRNKFLSTASLSLTGLSNLDLADNNLILSYTGDSPEQTIQQWANHTLVASKGADPSFSQSARILAVFDNHDAHFASLGGVPLDPAFNQVLVKYTYLGDANADGKVDPTDYAVVDGKIGLGHSWITGDLNFDGKVDPTDYAQIDGNQGAGQGGVGGPQLASLPVSNRLMGSILPQPDSATGDVPLSSGPNSVVPAPLTPAQGRAAPFSTTPITDDGDPLFTPLQDVLQR